jgi:septal ring factor EnvC (AmiA/AmiB activator)
VVCNLSLSFLIMPERHSRLISFFLSFVVFMEELMVLGVNPSDRDSTAKTFAGLKTKLAKEKVAQEKAENENETLARAVKDLKKTADWFAAQIPALEEKVQHLDNKVIETLNDASAKELSWERITKSNEDFKSQNV